MQPGPCAPPTSNLNTESARLSLSLSKEKKRREGKEGARKRERGPDGDRRRLDKNGEEAERKGGGGLYRFRGLRRPHGNSGTEPSSSPSLSGILIIRAGSLRGESSPDKDAAQLDSFLPRARC